MPDLVEETVVRLRTEVLTRIEMEKAAGQPLNRRPRSAPLSRAELEQELARLVDRMERCRRNMAESPRENPEARQHFLVISQKRVDALEAAIRRLGDGT
ncbi:MAG TPA: hypothetical protein VMF52_10735 [Steroidobacteraceae bacterium]|nr:hypothetical protein [Steroidobacteraceae bacterium]